jgi:hypothetical protein
MKALPKLLVLTAIALSTAFLSTAADAEKDNPTKTFMKKYHKAPQGTDPVAKRAAAGKATPEELKDLAAGYKAMTMAKPPKGEMTSWKEKTTKVADAAAAMAKGDPDGVARYKQASNCKACHSEHKPD